jgi:hypothetical protein
MEQMTTLGKCQFHKNDKVEMVVCERFRMQEPDLNSWQDGMNPTMYSGIVLKNNDISVE